jgi:hypothetical protein
MTRIIDPLFRIFATDNGWEEGSESFNRGAEYIESVVTGYISVMLWSEHCNGWAPSSVCDHDGRTGDDRNDCDKSLERLNYGECDLSGEAYAVIREHVANFVTDNLADLYGRNAWMDPEQAGHDFFLTRNGHGAGFWDRGLGDRGDRLTKSAKSWGEMSTYIGDDELIHVS